MTPERWQQVENLFHAVLECDPGQREAFLTTECAHDDALRVEVDSLISAHEGAPDFIEVPAGDFAAEMLGWHESELVPGREIGNYKLVRELGSGGMGEVYLANDNRLSRQIALKILPPQFTTNQDRVRRFKREARAASALNHPNIVTIHEIGECDGTHFIATEYVDGKTLRELIKERPLNLREALNVAIQVASALTAAHAAGIVHRDIKPENIMIRADGYVKILDFGLAKLAETIPESDLEIQTLLQSNPGLIMGTVQYMSPEQARGRKVDARADVWSLGIVLYELLAGHVPFSGETPSHIMVAIMEGKLPRLSDQAGVPVELDGIVSHALCKNQHERYRSAKALARDLNNLKRQLQRHPVLSGCLEKVPSQEKTHPLAPTVDANSAKLAIGIGEKPNPARSFIASKITRRVMLLIAMLAVVLGGVFVWRMWQGQNHGLRFLRPTQVTTWPSLDIYPAFSPDGKFIAYCSDHSRSFEIYLKSLAAGTHETQLTFDGQQNLQPTFSPDGKTIAFYSKGRGGIWTIPTTGGETKQLTSFGSRPAWSPDGTLITFQSNPLTDLGASALPAIEPSTIWIVSARGGEPRQLTQAGNPAGGHGSPAWSPDGKRIVFCASSFVLSSVWTVSSQGGDLKQAAKGYLTDAVYAPDGENIYYGSDFGLWKIHVSAVSGEPLGEPVELSSTSQTRLRHFAVSPDGKRIAYAPLSIVSNLRALRLSPETSAALGDSVSLTEDRRFRNAFPSYSANGKRITYQSFNIGGESNVWRMDADGKNGVQVTSEGGFCPNWFPDGERILFTSNRQGHWNAWTTDLRDGQDKALLDFGEDDIQYVRLSPDGRQIAFNSKKSGTINLALISTSGGPARQLTFDKELAGFPCWSPDGKTLGFQIKRGDSTYVSVMPSGGGEVTQLTFDQGQSWAFSFSPDGDKILFAGLRNGLWNLYWVSRSTREQKQLTNNTKLNSYMRYPSWSPLGDQIAFEYAETIGNIWIADLQ